MSAPGAKAPAANGKPAPRPAQHRSAAPKAAQSKPNNFAAPKAAQAKPNHSAAPKAAQAQPNHSAAARGAAGFAHGEPDARRAAVSALMRQDRGGYANLVLANALAHFDGDAQQRAFVAALFYGAVERAVTLDYLLERCLVRPLAGMDACVRAVLRAGLYQARWMDSVPLHAAVNESVELVRRMGRGSAAGLVNAVLRRAAAIDLHRESFESDAQRLSVLYSVSQELAQLLAAKLGPDDCEGLLAASFTAPALCVRVNTCRTDPLSLAQALEGEGIAVRAGGVPGSLYLEGAGDVTQRRAFCEGLFHVQGEASQLACAALAPRPGQKVVDLCAAPGGKSVTLAQYMEDRGTLLCRDKAANRVPLIRRALERAHITCADAAQGDGAVYDASLADADAVLCDVPCSGLGVLAKKPDIRTRSLAQLDELTALQGRILANAARCVRPGGRLVYSTCTVNPDENEAVVTSFLKENPDFCLRAVPFLPAHARVRGGMVTLLPHLTGLDGFFIALLERAER